MGMVAECDVFFAFRKLISHNDAHLVDVRTPPEWAYVGVADLSALGKEPIYQPWLSYPDNKPVESFTDKLREKLKVAAFGHSGHPVLFFLCRSGVRSRAAGWAMSEIGYSAIYNITHGFEGDPDRHGRRNLTNGWRFRGLPWRQS